MHKKLLTSGAVFGGLSVAIGAFGAHGLRRLTSDEQIIHTFETGVEYQMYHALALIFCGIIYQHFPNKLIRWAGTLFIVGIFLFCGSLYALAFLKVQESEAVNYIGPVTPLGGLLFIAGWMCFLAAVARKQA
jgi:uncharacterized membrane protein YgdD (TMEM256/DUF423 family)